MSSEKLGVIAVGIAMQAAQIQALMALACSNESEARGAYLVLFEELKNKDECVSWDDLVHQTVVVMKECNLGWWSRAGFLTKIEIGMENFGVTPGAIKDYKNSVHALCKVVF